MLRIEILDQDEKILSTHRVRETLTLLGQSPGAHIPLRGKGIGALHVGIKLGAKPSDAPIVMDLGGPTRLRVNGKAIIEHVIDADQTTLEIGSRKVRVCRLKDGLVDLRAKPWAPVTDLPDAKKDSSLAIRVRLYVKGLPIDVVNSKNEFALDSSFGPSERFKMVWIKGKQVMAKLPEEWIRLGGRIQSGKEKIGKLADWQTETALEQDTIYRVFAGPYLAEILVTKGQALIASPKLDLFPKEFRKPFTISLSVVIAFFATWSYLMNREATKVEEPYPVFARIQNVPIEKIMEPEPSNEPQAGGGSGSESRETTAPTAGAAASPSKLAASLTGGLKNLVGNVLSQAKSSGAVVAETGLASAAQAMGGGAAVATKLASVGQGTGSLAGATKLGNLALAGSGKGFGGGSGTGLGTGSGAGIGTGVGNGIGRGSFRLVEEESIVDGGLDKSVIAAVIQNNLSQIKYCYERQLVAEPDLFGKVVVLWQINATGNVESARVKQTTLNSNPVEHCMLGKISGWKFPQPKNGTKVTVSYPFLFKSTK